MNESDIADWEREIKHAQNMQEQRKSKRDGWDGKDPVIKATITIPFNTYSIKDNDNEINNQ